MQFSLSNLGIVVNEINKLIRILLPVLNSRFLLLKEPYL